MTEEQKNQLTFSLTQVMENWQLADQEQITLLGLKSIKPRHLYLYRRGDKSFDFDETSIKRAEMILGIHESLGTTYPANRDYASLWLKRGVKKFKHKAPLELMLSGEVGMKRVWHFLDCTQGWRD
ncbi:hypothetical protein [uncultured Gammaproteobacteria bacterium]|jgi:hypothetical protein|uniref:Antitoxin Xre/MbcA/ParS-like toxin-binding domain-containing protein n=3 Tax=sulfur-oxidizing symbionts TaxID=32036 RepID=A0A1H6K3V0_9GAMM|nr:MULTISPECIES: DUF2384 domain-containing protein [Gammaproteobacteria]CAC9432916.1 hypothetical protein [uncultured Gammaproteobacteria bacterium]CAB5497371.1 hypothetical protein AZO1586I_163 [Bathymodiolus thermophilus thioautotrophic gill symbiont]CAB5498586.1 hypothetical protein AZO1586R_789 [Bathymodiolus azoricus thioautotrophic gill symbiont]CAC9498570.1 hypothetical protein [uncultured Gammaproteobacteria bacterium]CAC9531853.1 hypothetical protein [uncultured Gammaproteobacteria ba